MFEWLLFNTKLSSFSAIPWREQVAFLWDDNYHDDVRTRPIWVKIIFSSCFRFLICRCVRDLTKRRRYPVSDLGSMSELTNQIIVITFKILKAAIWLVNSLIDPRSLTRGCLRRFVRSLTQRHIRKREQDENMILIWLVRRHLYVPSFSMKF